MQANRHRKTQIALEYAYRRSLRDPACSVFWVHADNETTFAQDYKLIAEKLGLAGSLDGTELLKTVRDRIEADPCWLVVFDNADDVGLFGVGATLQRRRQSRTADEAISLYDFVPRGPGGAVLWTSCDKQIGGSLVSAQRAINIARMTDSETMTLLETVRNRKIAQRLVCRPLTIPPLPHNRRRYPTTSRIRTNAAKPRNSFRDRYSGIPVLGGQLPAQRTFILGFAKRGDTFKNRRELS